MPDQNQTSRPCGESIAAIVTSIVGLILFTTLLVKGQIESGVYATLTALTAFAAIVLYGFRRIRKLDFKNLKLTLRRLEEVRKEIFAKEKDLKHASLELAKLIVFHGAFAHRIGSDESYKLEADWRDMKIKQLLDAFDFTDTDRFEVHKYTAALEEFDRIKKENPELKQKHHGKVMEMIREDLLKATTQPTAHENKQ